MAMMRVCNDKVNRNCGANVEDALLNSSPVEDVLGPAVLVARDNAKHVLHAESDSRPVMCFHLRHRDKKVSLKNRPRQPQMAHAGVAGAKRCTDQFVTIQIHETDSLILKMLAITGFHEHQLYVPLVSWPFRNQNHSCSEAPEALRSRQNQQRVCVDGLSGDVVH